MIRFFFQLYTAKVLQQKNLIMIYGKLVTVPINGKWASSPTVSKHLKTIVYKLNKTIGLLCKFQNFLPRKLLIIIYRFFMWPQLDFGYIIYDQSYNTSFHQRLESLQCNAALAITCAIRGTSIEKLYNEIGLESLQNRRWYRKLSFLYKVIASQSPSYLFNGIPRKDTSHHARVSDNIPLLSSKHNFFQSSYFPAAIKEWNKLDIDIRKSDTISIFKKYIPSFIQPLPNKVSNSHNPQGLKLLKRLRLSLSHLRYKFKHKFLDTINPFCSCRLILKQLFIFFSTAQGLWSVETPFWAKFLKLIVIW